jgi:hypothetical protein
MMAILDAHHERTVASLGKTEATDFKAISEEMESVTEHQENPKREAAVMPVGEPRKRHRVQNLAAELRQKRKERKDLGKSWIQEEVNCRLQEGVQQWHGEKGTYSGKLGPWKCVVDASDAVMETRRSNGRRKNKTRNKFARETRIGRMLGRRQLMRQKDTNRTRNRDLKEQLRLGNERTTSGIYKTIGLEIMNRALGISSELQRIRNWTL